MDMTTEQACKIVCKLCDGKDEEFDPVPYRNEREYIENYGEVNPGEWYHKSNCGGVRRCDAENIYEYIRKLQGGT